MHIIFLPVNLYDTAFDIKSTQKKNIGMGNMSPSPHVSLSQSSIIDDNRLLNSEQDKDNEPRREEDASHLVRILDIPQSLFQRSEDTPSRMRPSESQEEAQNDDTSSPQRDETPIPPPLIYEAGELANEVLTMIDSDHDDHDDHEEDNTNTHPIHGEGLLARMLQMRSSFFDHFEDPTLNTNQRQYNFSSSEQDETNEFFSPEDGITDVVDEVLAVLTDGNDNENDNGDDDFFQMEPYRYSIR